MARALPILIHAETSACPAIGQLRNTLIHDLFRKGARTFCRYLPRMSPVLPYDLARPVRRSWSFGRKSGSSKFAQLTH